MYANSSPTFYFFRCLIRYAIRVILLFTMLQCWHSFSIYYAMMLIKASKRTSVKCSLSRTVYVNFHLNTNLINAHITPPNRRFSPTRQFENIRESRLENSQLRFVKVSGYHDVRILSLILTFFPYDLWSWKEFFVWSKFLVCKRLKDSDNQCFLVYHR